MVLLLACNDQQGKDDCIPVPPDAHLVAFNLPCLYYKDDGRLGTGIQQDLIMTDGPVDPKRFRSALEIWTTPNSLDRSHVVGVVYYSTVGVDGRPQDSCLGALFYTQQNGFLQAEIYLRSAGFWLPKDSLSGPVGMISSNDFFALSRIVEPSRKRDIILYSFLSSNYSKPFNERSPLILHRIPNVKSKAAPNLGCYLPCPLFEGELVCGVDEFGITTCIDENEPLICPESMVRDRITADDQTYTFQSQPMYAVRDQLAQSAKGCQFIQEYYELGDILANNGLPLDLALLAMTNGSKLYTVMQAYAEDPHSSTIFASEQRGYVQEILNALCNQYQDPHLVAIVQHISGFLDDIEGRSFAEITAHLQL